VFRKGGCRRRAGGRTSVKRGTGPGTRSVAAGQADKDNDAWKNLALLANWQEKVLPRQLHKGRIEILQEEILNVRGQKHGRKESTSLESRCWKYNIGT